MNKVGFVGEIPQTYYDRFEDAFVREANEFAAVCLGESVLPFNLGAAVHAVRKA